MNRFQVPLVPAPGSPGLTPLWSPSAKDGIGTAYHGACRLWFTLARGVVTEVYCPTVDTPNTRDLQFLVSDGATFCHEEEFDFTHETEMLEKGVLAYRQINTEKEGRYRLVKEIITEPHSSVLIVQVRLEIHEAALRGKLRLYALLAPHLGGYGSQNNVSLLDVGERTLLHASREDFHLIMGCDRGFSKRSVGYLGTSDGWQDLHKGNFQMDWEYRQAGPGAVSVMGQVHLDHAWTEGGSRADFILGLSFGDSQVSASAKLLQALALPFAKHRANYISQWHRAAVKPEDEKDVFANTGDGGHVYCLSHRVLLAHEDKNFQGALVASLSTPWGEIKTDSDAGGYHLVWTRDLVQSASALLASGEIDTPLRALLWLTCIQKPDGSFPQNSWIDGTPYWQSIQVDEIASPLLLGWRLWKVAPESFDHAGFRSVLIGASSYLMSAGPVTAQDRWEENSGYSPSTIATIIAALCAGAELKQAHGKGDEAEILLHYADWLNSHLEGWCVTDAGELLGGKPRYYLRITPADPMMPDCNPQPDTLEISLGNGGGRHPARNVNSGDFLHLVRLGIRPADDPVILDSLAVYDATLKHDLPGGPCWRRYPHDGYGQKADGTPYNGTGEGRCWPILTGERGHYELAAGRDPLPYIRAMEQFANKTGLLPEQVWDADDIPRHHQFRGRPSGSANPLCWSHAEYLSLVRSRRDAKVFDRIEPAFQRYVVAGKRDCSFEHWTFRHRTSRIPAGRSLRLILLAAARIRWTADNWATGTDLETTLTHAETLHFVDLLTSQFPAGTRLEWTFFWLEAGRWEGANFQAEVTP